MVIRQADRDGDATDGNTTDCDRDGDATDGNMTDSFIQMVGVLW